MSNRKDETTNPLFPATPPRPSESLATGAKGPQSAVNTPMGAPIRPVGDALPEADKSTFAPLSTDSSKELADAEARAKAASDAAKAAKEAMKAAMKAANDAAKAASGEAFRDAVSGHAARVPMLRALWAVINESKSPSLSPSEVYAALDKVEDALHSQGPGRYARTDSKGAKGTGSAVFKYPEGKNDDGTTLYVTESVSAILAAMATCGHIVKTGNGAKGTRYWKAPK